MSSISVRFNSFLFLYSIFNEHKAPCSSFRKASCFFRHRAPRLQLFAERPRSLAPDTVGWSVWMDSNHRPHAYQACALTTWATNRFLLAHLVLVRVIFLSASADWWRWWGSNPWPPACRAGALPAELHPHILYEVSLSFPFGHSKSNNKRSVLVL